MKFFELEQIMSEFGITTLADIARSLNTTPQAVSNWKGRDQIVENFNAVFEDTLDDAFWSMHANTGHQVKITGPSSAQGQIYLLDIVTDKKPDENPFLWFAVYDEDYVKRGDEWKIKRSSIHFLWPEKHLDPKFIGR